MEKELTLGSRLSAANAMIIDISGDVTIYNASKLREEFEKHFRQGINKFIINLKELILIDSAGIGVLFTILSMVQDGTGIAVLLNPNANVRKLFALTQVDEYFTIVASESEALEKINAAKKG